jgi:2'-5' RNA ligase
VRLFVAIEIPANIRAAIASLMQEFRAMAPNVKWVRPESLHLTLKFLGETDPGKLGAIEHLLAAIHSAQPVTLDFTGLGFFPNAQSPRVFWAGINSSSNLQSIVSEIDGALHLLGFPPEDRTFTPHLTLARIHQPALPPKLIGTIAQNFSCCFGSCEAREFHLIESKLKPAGAEYTTLQSFSFVAEARR